MRNYLKLFVLLLVGFQLSCADQSLISELEPVSESSDLQATEKVSYLIQAGDKIDIKFFYNKDLNTQVVVRPDGKIALQLVGEVQAAGLTLEQLDNVLTKNYGQELLNPEITVNLNGFEGLRVYVGGQVNRQGFIAFRNNMTPLQAILNAGGLDKFADPGSTVIIRKDQYNKTISITVDLAMVLAGKNSDSDFILLPDDIVYVPTK